MTLKISMNLKSLPDFIVFRYGTIVIDDLEIILLYDYSQSRYIYPYHKYNQFNLQIFDEAQFVTEFRFVGEIEIARLSEAL